MARILREPDQGTMVEVAKKLKASDRSIYRWRRRFGKLEPLDVERRGQLEHESAMLQKLVAERDLEIDVAREVTAKKVVSADARRAKVAYVRGRGVS